MAIIAAAGPAPGFLARAEGAGVSSAIGRRRNSGARAIEALPIKARPGRLGKSS